MAIETALEELYWRWQQGELIVSPDVRVEVLRRFSRPALAKRLAKVLADAAG